MSLTREVFEKSPDKYCLFLANMRPRRFDSLVQLELLNLSSLNPIQHVSISMDTVD